MGLLVDDLLSPEQRENTEILALSVDEREMQQMMIDRVAKDDGILIDFPLLTDPDHRIIDRYGLFNPNESRMRPVPHPTALVIDRNGVVRWKFVEIDYRVRPTSQDILAALSELD